MTNNMNKYPRIGRKQKVRPQGLCRVCDEAKSDLRVHVQYNFMRGDDDVFKCHSGECFEKFKLDIDTYIYGRVDESQGMQ